MSDTPDTTGLRETIIAALEQPVHAPMADHDQRDGSCSSCPWPLHMVESPAGMADAILASDWLAAHDAEVQRVTAERIAQAIEAARDKLHPAFSTEDHGNLPRGYTNAARIAREEASRG